MLVMRCRLGQDLSASDHIGPEAMRVDERARKRMVLAAGACALVAGGVTWWVRARPVVVSPLSPFASAVQTAAAHADVPVLFEAPAFTDFVDQDGRPSSNRQLAGRVWVADFIFTHCAGSCPRVMAAFVELQKAIDD